MFYEVFFGIVAGVTVSVVIATGLHLFFFWLTGGKARYERMSREHEEHRRQVEEEMEKRQK